MPITSDTEQEILNHFMDEVEKAKRGEADVFDVGTRLNQAQKALSDLYDEIKDHILEERRKYSSKEDVIRNGYIITEAGRKYYSYSHDDGYQELKEQLSDRKDLIKKATNKGIELADPVTGEMVSPGDVKERSWPILKYVGDHYGSN